VTVGRAVWAVFHKLPIAVLMLGGILYDVYFVFMPILWYLWYNITVLMMVEF